MRRLSSVIIIGDTDVLRRAIFGRRKIHRRLAWIWCNATVYGRFLIRPATAGLCTLRRRGRALVIPAARQYRIARY